VISLLKSIEQIEYYATRFRAAVTCFATAIASLEKRLTTGNITQDAGRHSRLQKLHDQLAGEPALEVMFEVSKALDAELECYRQAMNGALADNQSEMRDVVEVLGGLMASLAEQTGKGRSRLQNLSKQLEGVAELKSALEMRQRLFTHIADLRSYAAESEKENQEVITHLQHEVKCIRQKLATVEELAATDPLTGAANRRECERQLERRIRSGKPFSVLFYDVDRFKEINDRYGHKWGDNVLVTFARRLADQLRATDMLVRWGGDEFLVIFDCGLEEARRRGLILAEKAGGWYDLAFNGKALRVDVRTSFGAAEYLPGETIEQLFTRVDDCLYRDKPGKLEQPAPQPA